MCLKEVPLRWDVPTAEPKSRRFLAREYNSTLPISLFIGNQFISLHLITPLNYRCCPIINTRMPLIVRINGKRLLAFVFAVFCLSPLLFRRVSEPRTVLSGVFPILGKRHERSARAHQALVTPSARTQAASRHAPHSLRATRSRALPSLPASPAGASRTEPRRTHAGLPGRHRKWYREGHASPQADAASRT